VANISSPEFETDLGGSFPTIKETLMHILWVELLFLRRWQGSSTVDLSQPPDLHGVEAIKAAWEKLEKERTHYLRELNEGKLDETIQFLNTRGQSISIELWQAIFQCANHSTFHRGQIVTKFRQLGKVPPLTDFVLFCRES
jgi:uncharacterized damage-inducible protein DinB